MLFFDFVTIRILNAQFLEKFKNYKNTVYPYYYVIFITTTVGSWLVVKKINHRLDNIQSSLLILFLGLLDYSIHSSGIVIKSSFRKSCLDDGLCNHLTSFLFNKSFGSNLLWKVLIIETFQGKKTFRTLL